MQAPATRPGARRGWRALRIRAMPVLLLVIVAGFYWKLTLTRQYTWLEYPGAAAQVLPRLDFEAREVHGRRLPLWDPYETGGRNLIGEARPGTANPLAWLLFVTPLREGHLRVEFLHGWWVFLHWLAAVGTFALARELRIGRCGAVLAGAAFACSGFMGLEWRPQDLSAALWIPWLLFFLLRAMRHDGPMAPASLCGLALGMAWLSGSLRIAGYLSLTAAILWLSAIAVQRARWRGAAICAGIALMVGAPGSWVSGGRADAISFPSRAGMLPGLILPVNFAGPSPFLGVTVIAMAALGAAANWKRRETKLMMALAVGGFGCAIAVPAPAGPLAIAQAAGCVLAGMGLDALPAFGGPLRRWRWGLLGFGGLILSVYAVAGFMHLEANDRPVITGAAALLLALVLFGCESRSLSPVAAGVCVTALALLEAGTISSVDLPESDRKDSVLARMRNEAELGDFLRREQGWFRVQADARDVPYDFGNWFGIEPADGTVSADAARLFGVKYYLARKPPRPGLVDVYEAGTGLKAFRDPAATPPFRGVPANACDVAAQLKLEARNTSGTVIVARMGCAGTVVVADAFAPGWRVWVNHRPHELYPAAGFLAVSVPAGTSRIEFRYRPRIVYAAGLSLAGFILAGVLILRSRTA